MIPRRNIPAMRAAPFVVARRNLRATRLRMAAAAIREARGYRDDGDHASASLALSIARYWRARAHGVDRATAMAAMRAA